ncbi:hypothetical protein [Planktothrix phage Pra-JY27]|nr:hypothetical protein [Planktothrix phage Pag-Yong1]WEV89254.1 hypothetical protein [Synechococcus phage MinM2]
MPRVIPPRPLTVADLRGIGACPGGIWRFTASFGDSTLVAPSRDWMGAAYRSHLWSSDFGWAAGRLLPHDWSSIYFTVTQEAFDRLPCFDHDAGRRIRIAVFATLYAHHGAP